MSAETPIFIVFPALHCFGPKKTFWPKQIVCTKMRFFSLPDTNRVRQFLLKIHSFWFFTFLDDHLKKSYFYRVFWPFPFSVFSFLFLVHQHKKKKKQKCNFLFEYLFFDIPQILQKTLFWHTVTLFVFLKMPKNTINWGKQQKQTWTNF